MEATDTTEKGFESLIVNWLVNHNGYEQGQNRDYNTEYALDTARLFRFLKKHSAGRGEKAPVGNQSTKNGAVSRPRARRDHQARHC